MIFICLSACQDGFLEGCRPVIGLDGNSPPLFKMIFICLSACWDDFLEGCRLVIGLDGCHLKGPYSGFLLATIFMDANLQFFPLTYAIVEMEDSGSWHWFLELLVEVTVRDIHFKPWSIISDR